VSEPDLGEWPRRAIERLILHDSLAEKAEVEYSGVNAAFGQFSLCNICRESAGMQVLQAALPFCEWRRPVSTVGNLYIVKTAQGTLSW
jgi:hypothetical protein